MRRRFTIRIIVRNGKVEIRYPEPEYMGQACFTLSSIVEGILRDLGIDIREKRIEHYPPEMWRGVEQRRVERRYYEYAYG